MSARTNGLRCETWRNAHLAFFNSKIYFLEGSIPNERTMRTWWSQRHQYLTDEEISKQLWFLSRRWSCCFHHSDFRDSAGMISSYNVESALQSMRRSPASCWGGQADYLWRTGQERRRRLPSAGNFGIGSRDIDSADGGWDDRMGDSHKSDAEQSEAGGGRRVREFVGN